MEFSVLNGISCLVDFSNFGKFVVLIWFSDCSFLEFGRFRRFEVCVLSGLVEIGCWSWYKADL